MPSARYNLVVEIGATFNPVFTWKDSNGAPIDLSGYKARMQIRADINDVTPIADLSTEHSPPEITLGGPAGTITLLLTAAVTEAITADSGVYDLEVYTGTAPTETVVRLLSGKATFSPEVTRP